MDLDIDHSGKVIAGYSDGMVREFTFKTSSGQFELLRFWKAHQNAVLQVGRVGRFAFTSSSGGEVALWDAEGGEMWKRRVLTAGVDVVDSYCLQDGFLLAVAGDSGDLVALKFNENGEERWEVREEGAHGAAIHGLRLLTARDILTCSIDQRLSHWVLSGGTEFTLKDQVMINVADVGCMEVSPLPARDKNEKTWLVAIGGVGIENLHFTLTS
ncbi:hypothetical protein BT69DRAFT_242158 [Atractiella rhizophila]|nr:hypothetical protein BT69DRAFT_242158 [Atractiella rhizophila]